MAQNNCLNQNHITTTLQTLIGVTGDRPAAAGLTAGTNITITNIGAINVQHTLPQIRQWSNASGTATTGVTGRGYYHTTANTWTMTLPASPAVGDCLGIVNNSGFFWQVTVPSGQTLIIGGKVVTGAFTIVSTASNDTIEIVCIATNTWSVKQFTGNITYA
jgi:hypothetical protein